MSIHPSIVIFFNDWKVYPEGINAGGGEVAIMALARALSKRGYRVIACANLPDGECRVDGIEFWNFGANYALRQIEERLRNIGPYYCLAATLVHPFLLLDGQENCKVKILINHSANPLASGVEPVTLMNNVDKSVCVSRAQRSYFLIRGAGPEKQVIIPNGFDPDIFPYAGPEGRDWQHLVFIGRLESSKGIHLAVTAYTKLLAKFPRLKFSIFGDSSYWPQFEEGMPALQKNFPGITFHGKVPQSVLSEYLRRAGLLVFPSISFESAGLAVIDAQASGCPAVACAVGGVPEYLFDGLCGKLVHDCSADALEANISNLLENPHTLEMMSRNGKDIARKHTWDLVAQKFIQLAESVVLDKEHPERNAILREEMPEPCKRTFRWREISAPVLSNDHEEIASGKVISLEKIDQYCQLLSDFSAPFLWRGLIADKMGQRDEAEAFFQKALERSDPHDWQALFLITALQADRGRLREAKGFANALLLHNPGFEYRNDLRKLVHECEIRGF
jgi:glycosyltransferase involved in cell wall biosynthesis